MTQLPPIRLLTTRLRIALAMGLTALVLVQEIRGLHPHRAGPVWLLGPPLLHGWVLMAVNVLLYAYICWLAFWCVRGTAGRERFSWWGGLWVSCCGRLRFYGHVRLYQSSTLAVSD